MGFTRVALAAALAAVSILGAAAPQVSAADRLDDACMKQQRAKGVSYETAKARCTVKVTVTSSRAPSLRRTGTSLDLLRNLSPAVTTGGFIGWETGNALWSFKTEVWYDEVEKTCVPVGACGTWARITNVTCVKQFAYIISLDIKQCPEKGWRFTYKSRAGAFYETSFGPVSEGLHSFRIFPDGGSSFFDQGSN